MNGNDMKKLRDQLLADPYRPRYHFADPGLNGFPGDPNAAFYADGRYHLMYLYHDEQADGWCWGHISSDDLLHWISHPDALGTEDGDQGCYSGGAFVDDDGRAYISFWKWYSKNCKGDNGGIGLAYADPPYDHWERIRPLAVECSKDMWGIREMEINGQTVHIGCADPSNIWKENGMYYIQSGNKSVLDRFGRTPGSPQKYQGDWTELFRSSDLKNWEYAHRFYKNPRLDDDYPAKDEDNMCTSFLPLADENGQPTGKYLEMFISHNYGAQYYIGSLNHETFYPESHGRFSHRDRLCFACEALTDDKGRQIAWFWLHDNPIISKDKYEPQGVKSDDIFPMQLTDAYNKYGWQGVFTFPRQLWLQDGRLHMAPIEELDRICRVKKTFYPGKISEDLTLDSPNPECVRIQAVVKAERSGKAGFVLTGNKDLTEYVRTYVDFEKQVLRVETVPVKVNNTEYVTDYWVIPGKHEIEEAPIYIEGDRIEFDILVDKSIVEVYVNKTQAICRRYFSETALPTITAMGGAEYEYITASRVEPTNYF